MSQTYPSTVDDYRRRYEALKTAGTAPKALPPPSDRALAGCDPASVRHREEISDGWYWTRRLGRGETLRLINTSGNPGISLFAWNAADTAERYNAADTVKIQWTARLQKGRLLLTDMGRVLFAIVEDSCGRHDAIVGGSTPESVLRRTGQPGRNTRDNLILAASKHGLGRQDVGPCITFFAPVTTTQAGRFAWDDGLIVPGDFVDLRAEMDALVAVSNCPHPLAPDTACHGPIEVVVLAPHPVADDDLCRTATDEARRAVENTQSWLAEGGR